MLLEGASASPRQDRINESEQRVAVITGATGGIGRWIALGLARAGHHVVMIARDAARGDAAAAWIRQSVPGASIEVKLADLSSLGATRTIISANRKTDARQLDRKVRGELDWIVMKALEKDRRQIGRAHV